MPSKRVVVPELGEVLLVKRRGARSIRLTIPGNTSIRVSLPLWLPYSAAITFIHGKRDWIRQHLDAPRFLEDGQLVGKSHRLKYIASPGHDSARTRISPTEIKVFHAGDATAKDTQESAKKAALKALKAECQALLPEHTQALAYKFGFEYNSLSFKRLKTRWGSCSHDQHIVLNIFLMQLPWPLVDYVIIHELVHTKVLNHGPKFWELFEQCLPGAKQRRKELKAYHPYF